MLVLFRLIQGATGGAMQPLSQAVMLEAFPPAQRGKAMGFWGLGIVVAPILGPVLGGWLTDSYSWRWVFYINLPVGIASIVMTRAFIFDPPYMKTREQPRGLLGHRTARGGHRRPAAAARQGAGGGLVLVALHDSSSPCSRSCALVVFLVHEWYADEPVVDLRVFKIRTYSTGVFLMTTLGFVLYGSLVLLPILLQTLLGYPSLQAGIAMAPRGLGSFIGMPMVGLLIGRFDPRKMVAVGLFVGGLTLLWLGQLNLNAGYWDFFWPQFVQGLGLSMLFVPLTTISMDPIPRERMGNATSLFNLMRNIGGQHRHRRDRHDAGARSSRCTSTCSATNIDAYNPASRAMLESMTGGVHGPRRRRVHGEPARVRRGVRPRAAAGGDGHLRRDLPDARLHLPAADPAHAAHEAAVGTRRSGRGALTGTARLKSGPRYTVTVARLKSGPARSGPRSVAWQTGGLTEGLRGGRWARLQRV